MIKKLIMKVKKVFAQTFPRFKVQYRLNKAKNRLEELPDKVDIQELINSDKEFALHSILDKFLGVPESISVVSHDRNIDKLDLLNEASDLINDYCDSNNLSTENVSLAKILEHIKSKYKNVNGIIENEKKIDYNISGMKESIENEKAYFEEEKQKNIQNNSK